MEVASFDVLNDDVWCFNFVSRPVFVLHAATEKRIFEYQFQIQSTLVISNSMEPYVLVSEVLDKRC